METAATKETYPLYYKAYDSILGFNQDGAQSGDYMDTWDEDLFETTLQ